MCVCVFFFFFALYGLALPSLSFSLSVHCHELYMYIYAVSGACIIAHSMHVKKRCLVQMPTAKALTCLYRCAV